MQCKNQGRLSSVIAFLGGGQHAACDLLRSEQSVSTDAQSWAVPLPLPNSYRLPGRHWALALSLWWAKDAMYQWVTEFKPTMWDSVYTCFYVVHLCYIWHLPISPENKPLADVPYGVASSLKWEYSHRAVWFRKTDHFNGVKTITFNLSTFTLFYYWGVLAQASSHTPTQLLTYFGNLT